MEKKKEKNSPVYKTTEGKKNKDREPHIWGGRFGYWVLSLSISRSSGEVRSGLTGNRQEPWLPPALWWPLWLSLRHSTHGTSLSLSLLFFLQVGSFSFCPSEKYQETTIVWTSFNSSVAVQFSSSRLIYISRSTSSRLEPLCSFCWWPSKVTPLTGPLHRHVSDMPRSFFQFYFIWQRRCENKKPIETATPPHVNVVLLLR